MNDAQRVETRVEMIAIGDELLDGRTRDANAHYLGAALRRLGGSLERVTMINDEPQIMVETVRAAARRADLVITSGGLGPTLDDRTREALAVAAGQGLRQDTDTVARLHRKYEERGREMNDANLRQALFPQHARIFPSEVGTADVFETRVEDTAVISLPGVPREFRHFVDTLIATRLAGTTARRFHKLYAYGRGESSLATDLERAALPPEIKVTWSAHFPVVDIELSADPAAPDSLLDSAVVRAQSALRPWLFETDTRYANGAVAALLRTKKWRMVSAESCTGGLIASKLTDVPGSSRWFERGFIVYSNEAKREELGVEAALLEEHGAVSRQVAAAMAAGARRLRGVDVAIAVTGIAGPGGGSAEKPVGTVFLGYADGNFVHVIHACFPGRSRTDFKALVSELALMLLLRAAHGRHEELKRFDGVVAVHSESMP